MAYMSEKFYDGPIVNGQKTELRFYQAKDLAQYPSLEKLRVMINSSFDAADAAFFKIDRLTSVEEYVEEFGDGAFTYIVSVPIDSTNEVSTVAVGSARRYADSPSDTEETERWGQMWELVQIPDIDLENVEQWELKIIAVNSAYYRQGLGGYVLRLLEKECLRQFRLNSPPPSRRCQMVLNTMKEVNHEFYRRNGYNVHFEKFVPKDTIGNWGEFNVVHMNKLLPTE